MCVQCVKGMLNGPCGSMRDGKCEVGVKCPWYALYKEGKLTDEVKLDKGFLVKLEVKSREARAEFLKKALNDKIVYTLDLPPLPEMFPGKNILEMYDAVSVPDNPMARPYIDPVVYCYKVKQEFGVETIAHITARDRNRLALLSMFMTVGYAGVDGVMLVTGDHTIHSPYKVIRPVYDLDSVRMIYLARLVTDYGVDFRGKKLPYKPFFHIGAGWDPNIEAGLELIRIKRKIKAGAEFFESQAIFDIKPVVELLKTIKGAGIDVPLMLCLIPVYKLKELKFMPKLGVKVSKEYLDKILEIKDDPVKCREYSVNYLAAMAEEAAQVYDRIGYYIGSHGGFDLAEELTKEIKSRVG